MMQLVLDANILFAALIKDGTTRKIFMEKNAKFYVPEFIFHELFKHLAELRAKTNLSETVIKKQIIELFDLANIEIISSIEIKPFLKQAEKICPDINDIHYFALALKMKCPIWSEDKKLREQSEIKIITTKELMSY
ncbi:MAG: PIN domain-containing protein [Nanoarchaeota archaeon]|nr:PIN domain-containing protein [Nanoarchaeota archaeon]MBU1321026.1 PIN domain-containing protein [Nanoarchaeota archaeon]MBU1598440.1 PIN domain-containing protein [Nanoarchaeota archaeon]MBU2441366.1 PIN domain-containing protein [Nanoarchaeota archaeon]